MVDWAAACLTGVERATDSGCGAHRGAMGRKREPRGPHHGQEMAEGGWSEAGSVLIDEVIWMREAKPRCGMEAVGDDHPGGAFYRVVEGGERTGGEGEW
jgi:hypothetical protein